MDQNVHERCLSPNNCNKKEIHKKARILISMVYKFRFDLGGMTLKAFKVMLKVISTLFLLDGIYLIANDERFLGIVAMIVAFIFFPGSEKGKMPANGSDRKENDHISKYEGKYSSEGEGCSNGEDKSNSEGEK
jgi:hypothetical protein